MLKCMRCPHVLFNGLAASPYNIFAPYLLVSFVTTSRHAPNISMFFTPFIPKKGNIKMHVMPSRLIEYYTPTKHKAYRPSFADFSRCDIWQEFKNKYYSYRNQSHFSKQFGQRPRGFPL